MTKPTRFTQADVERAIRAAKAVGIEHPAVEIYPDGRIRLLTAPHGPKKALSPFEEWEQENGGRAA